MKTNRWAASVRDDAGATALFVAIITVILLGLAALVINAGMLYAERRSMQTAADSAALAGVQELPKNPGNAQTVANSYVTANPAGTQASSRTFTVSSTNLANDTLTVVVSQPAYALQLSQFIGMGTSPVGAHATAVVTSPTGYGSGVMPFGIMAQDGSATAAFGYAFNQSVTLKRQAGAGSSGNYGLLDLSGGHGGGIHNVTDPIDAGGWSSPIYIGDTVDTEPGKNGPQVPKALDDWIGGDTHTFGNVAQQLPDGTAKLLDPTCHRVIICPVIIDPGPPVSYNWDTLNGSKTVKIVSFAYFFVESVGSKGKDGEITGRFIRPLTPDEPISWGALDPIGAIGFRLTN